MFPCFDRLWCVDMAETNVAALPVPLQERIHAQAQETPQCQLFGQGRHSGDRTLYLKQVCGSGSVEFSISFEKLLTSNIFKNVIFDISSH